MSSKKNNDKVLSESYSAKFYSPIQKNVLLAFVEGHEKLKSGKFSKDFTPRHAQKLWESVTICLNAMEGATKTWQQWRKSYQDWKSRVKKEARAKIAREIEERSLARYDVDNENVLQTMESAEESESLFNFAVKADLADEDVGENSEEKYMDDMNVDGDEERSASISPTGDHRFNVEFVAVPSPMNLTKSVFSSTHTENAISGDNSKKNTYGHTHENTCNENDAQVEQLRVSKGLDEVISQLGNVTSVMKEHMMNMKYYYQDKLQIMRENRSFKERQTRALEDLAKALAKR